ncbi:Pycsar system effector family protein [Polaribacter sp. IC073]|uniref:Pycsar system effector family protein n=1 Tax=Polaribacter sp. IC073 TaxID=2508540 RepID=UPI0011BF998D|nr:Pycsar system effector family protein [Polaribacter sp. IC073]TXD46901.1 HD domain-containing protein [Polaribacter sp. IC073]
MNALIIEVEKFIFSFLNENIHPNFVYHNLAHTQRVVAKSKEIAENLALEPTALEDLVIAAWFHDTGYVDGAKNHEEKSAQIATAFLTAKNVSVKRVERVVAIILATEVNYVPKNNLEEIIRDADCAHLASKSFLDLTSLLRKEWELSSEKIYTQSEWIELNLSFLTQKHKYYTDFALRNWTKGKEKNLAKLLKNQKKLRSENKKFNQKEVALDLKKIKSEVPERGVETMFRVALRNHMTLSNIADTKANILLSVNAIIVSLALSNLLPKLDNPSNSHLLIPTIIFVAFTVASIVLSILATRPNVTEGKFTKEDVANKKVNLLFFGNFHQMKLDDFEWGISEMMVDRDYLYSSLTKDLYFLGLVLNRKYKILRITYTVFMIGIIVSVLAFAISFKYKESFV